ncbi:agamous-like MADS-box protein AGL61 [Gastrolobium bilobum]|uniref:agamous-like MADS-box protein AGL61 n=1 Tax=Gastrolobium bilobum TaxID=150636 RepID=UPI002AB1C3BF|nr:agamous-like MADS-box protein AGL61 [Gastrolobium bilobum]
MDMFNQRKKSTGRKKIEIKKIEKDSNKNVTFSKRRGGLFKKASELCILCNIHAAIIVFSPANKCYCFGQPNAETILTSYLKGTKDFNPTEPIDKSVSYNDVLDREYEEAIKRLELENKKLADTETIAKFWKKEDWWNESIDDMNNDQLEEFMMSMSELRWNLAERAGARVMMHPMQ